MENNLPNGWLTVSLKSLGLRFFKGVNVKEKGTEGDYYFIPSGANFSNGFRLDRIKRIRKKEFNLIDDSKILLPGDILFNSGGVGTLGRSSYFRGLDKKAVADSFVIVIRDESRKLESKYIYYWLQTYEADKLIAENTKGTTGITSIKSKDIEDFEIPIPSLAEQKRIIAKLDGLMEKIDHSSVRLERIPKILKRFRQSILSSAVSGKLTEEWRDSNSPNESALEYVNRIKSIAGAVETSDEDIPETWINVHFGQVFNIVRGSSPRPKGDPRYFSKKKTAYHWIMLSDFTDNTRNNVLVNTNEYLTEEGSRYGRHVNQNDILVGVSGVYGVGRTCLLDIEGYIYDGIMAIKGVNDPSLKKFINYFMQLQRMKLMDVSTGTSWPNINTDILKKYVCPIPPPNEQSEIARRVEYFFALADKIEARYNKAKVQFDKLPQSLLAKAFRGELVEQDANDEPASVLLEEIKASKITPKGSKRKLSLAI